MLHDAFIEAWRSIRAYDPARGSVQAWSLVGSRSRALDRLAQAKRRHSAQLVR